MRMLAGSWACASGLVLVLCGAAGTAAAQTPTTIAVRSALDGDDLVVTLTSPTPRQMSAEASGPELVVRFDGPTTFDLQPELVERSDRRIGSVMTGYDSLLLRAARDVEYRVTTPPGGLAVRIIARGAAEPVIHAQGERRLALLRAQWFATQARGHEELETLNALAASAPDDVEALTALGLAERRYGWRRRAESTFERALTLDRADPDVRKMLLLMKSERAPRLGVDVEQKDVHGEWQTTSRRTEGATAVSGAVLLGARVESIDFTAQRVRGFDGGITSMHRRLTRGEAWLDVDLRSGATVTTTLSASASGPGVAASYLTTGPSGQWALQTELNRPFWEFVEGLARDGTRERIALDRRQHLGYRMDGWVVVSSNRYRIADGASARTAGVTGGIVRALREGNLFLALWYGLDKESVIGATTRTDIWGNSFSPVPAVSREVHIPSVIVRLSTPSLLTLEANAGYAWDRFGGHGTIGEAHLRLNRGRLKGELWGDRRLQVLAATTIVTRVGLGLSTRF